jgi:DNA ligase (NAD+)
VDEGSRLYCPNSSCEKRILHQLQKWISVVDIRDFGDTLLRSLFKNHEVRSISDLYALTADALVPYFLNEESIENQKNSLGAKKVYESIQNHRKVALASFVAGLDIEGIGVTSVQKLIDSGLNTLEKLLSAEEKDIASVYGFAQITAHDLVQGFSENKEEIEKLISNGIIEIENPQGGSLSGMSFCFTGELKSMKRSDAENLVKNGGGSCKSSVTTDLSYLVTNDTASGSAKNEKAKKYGVKIINEDEFLALVKQS